MNKTELTNAIKAIDSNAKISSLDKYELEALLTELQAKALNHEVNEVAKQRTPEQQAADLKTAAEELDAIKTDESPALVNNAAEVVNTELSEAAPVDQAANVPRETKPEDLIKNDVVAAELTPAFYVVAEGKAITSKRGILPAGEAVQARDFVGGDETLNSLLERGLIE